MFLLLCEKKNLQKTLTKFITFKFLVIFVLYICNTILVIILTGYPEDRNKSIKLLSRILHFLHA